MENRKLSIRDEPNIRLKCSISKVLPMKTRLRVYVQNVSVCTGRTRTQVSTCARGAGTHGGVLNVHTETCFVDTLVFFQCATPHTTHHHTTQNNTQQHTETETEKEDRDRERRDDGRGETRQEKREDSFCSVVVHGLFCWCSDFLVSSVCARDLSLLKCQVRFIFDFFQCSLAG